VRQELTPCSTVLLEKLTGFLLVKKFPAFYETRKVHYRNHKLPPSVPILSQLDPVHTPTSWRSTLILCSHLCLGLPSGLFTSGFPTKALYSSLLSYTSATCPAHLILLDFITKILGEKYGTLSSSIRSFLHSPVTSSLFCPNILSAPYSQTSSAYFRPSMSATKFHTHTGTKHLYLM